MFNLDNNKEQNNTGKCENKINDDKLFLLFISTITQKQYDKNRTNIMLKYFKKIHLKIFKMPQTKSNNNDQIMIIMLCTLKNIEIYLQKIKQLDKTEDKNNNYYVELDLSMQIIEYMLHDSIIIKEFSTFKSNQSSCDTKQNKKQIINTLNEIYKILINKHSKIRDVVVCVSNNNNNNKQTIDIARSVCKDRIHSMSLRIYYLTRTLKMMI